VRLRLSFATLGLLLAISLKPVLCQELPSNPPTQNPPLMPGQQRPSPEDETRERIEKDMAKKANQERWEQLKRDTDSLLKLSNELKEYVDKANENTLSLDVIKKADQIEKLAHSVKEKMKGE
jgi:geranylgeranyl pyrophosphate synthase